MVKLRCEMDEKGLPRLQAPDGVLSREEHTVLQVVLQRNYRRLVEEGSRVLRVRFPSGPVSFRMTVRPGASRRCPALVLERVQNGNRVEPHQEQAGWVSGLTAEWEDLANSSFLLDVPADEQIALESALEDLCRQGEQRPDEFARLLLAGYLERASRLVLPSDPEKARRYALAARSLGGLRKQRGARRVS